MQLGQVDDLGFDPGPYGDGVTDELPGGDPSLVGGGGSPPLRIDPATATMLQQEFGSYIIDDTAIGTPAYIEPVEPDPQLSLVAVGIGVAIVGGALWYFS